MKRRKSEKIKRKWIPSGFPVEKFFSSIDLPFGKCPYVTPGLPPKRVPPPPGP